MEDEKRVKEIQELHDKIREKIGKGNARYQDKANKHMKRVVFQSTDLVWTRLRKERFP